ncbi:MULTISPECIES: TetR/AcrR family transcriptional regulator [unclassified Psychrobacillus]|uniref:TetR/AcrR family transcriptional regulator n=1 Tax=unclassified Psychrobacillus TaxID=2636677 RepID=UPI00146B0E90|nr:MULTISPECIES: TetR/AcrR family transcriptional regulator [unclassified Psychrobacillus]MCM3359708.1 TetR/AcrR family transcriptional regulator [Psychrobacillus sp. MER TA 171]NME06072.1 TetR/AcrR family transcriptional regulator [Psychrobacillus sp. BL-248-WT-3]
MSKREQQKQQRRENIIKIATELFLEQGIQTIQMQDIATAAGVGIATLFRYFPKKEYLVIAATNAITDKMATDVGEIVEQTIPAYEKIEQILDYYINVTKDPQLRLAKFFESFDLYEKIAEESPDQYAEYLSARSKLAGILLTVGDQGKQDGSLRSDADLQVFMMTMVQNFSIFAYKSRLTKHDAYLSSLLTAEKQLLMMKDVFLRYIRP